MYKHNFHLITFTKPTWCMYCSKFIYGLIHQGHECKVCKYQCHKKCVGSVPQECGKGLRPDRNSILNRSLNGFAVKAVESKKDWDIITLCCNTPNFLQVLSARDIKELVFVSKRISKIVSDFVSQTAYFYINDPQKAWKIYKPENCIIPSLSFSSSLPSSILRVRLPHSFNSPIDNNLSFPSSTSHLSFGDEFNNPSFTLFSATSIKNLTFGNNFNQIVDIKLPPFLSHLTFGAQFNQPIFVIPTSVTHITFGEKFNQSVETLSQASLTNLTFGNSFNKPVDNLPSSLTHLTFGESFNLPVNNLPVTLTHVEFGTSFNQKVTNLPANIVNLQFGGDFNQPINLLPKKIKYIKFGSDFNQKLEGLPPTLISVSFDSFFNQSVDNLPPTITHLTCGYHFNLKVDNLPKGLVYLKLGERFSQAVDHLPSSLTHLTILAKFNQPLSHLPSKLQYLQIAEYTGAITHLPSSLESLKFSTFHSDKIQFLPPYLKYLSFGEKNASSETSLISFGSKFPPTLHTLKLGNKYIDIDFPASLLHLSFCEEYNIFDANNRVPKLPPNLNSLEFSCKRKPDFPSGNTNKAAIFPSTLQTLSFGKGFNSPISIQFPKSLLHLNFRKSDFNYPINNLPPNLITLSLSHRFDHPIPSLPSTLESLYFGNSYNQPIHDLPPQLHTLKFGDRFDQPISSFPPKLEVLSFGSSFNQPLLSLPDSLEHITFNEGFPNGSQTQQNQFKSEIKYPPFLRTLYHGRGFAPNTHAAPLYLETISCGKCIDYFS